MLGCSVAAPFRTHLKSARSVWRACWRAVWLAVWLSGRLAAGLQAAVLANTHRGLHNTRPACDGRQQQAEKELPGTSTAVSAALLSSGLLSASAAAAAASWSQSHFTIYIELIG